MYWIIRNGGHYAYVGSEEDAQRVSAGLAKMEPTSTYGYEPIRKRARVGCLRCGWRGSRSRDLFAQCPTCGMPVELASDIRAIRQGQPVESRYCACEQGEGFGRASDGSRYCVRCGKRV